ncbi:hypothetical protein C8T65DRAFT_76426 [Cerioporus squamosus]|nr:hypothetical protein C8T65DRAFT_76426 [Cerioporus squamosus]
MREADGGAKRCLIPLVLLLRLGCLQHSSSRMRTLALAVRRRRRRWFLCRRKSTSLLGQCDVVVRTDRLTLYRIDSRFRFARLPRAEEPSFRLLSSCTCKALVRPTAWQYVSASRCPSTAPERRRPGRQSWTNESC